MNSIVFLGPTLSHAEATGILAATYLPPAQQGDIYRAVRALRPGAVGLVDGRFLDTGAVWHREILWALSQGVHVFGAASMGALRAAELAPFGMRGIGHVFTAYLEGSWPGDVDPFEDDDEVAVIHAPSEVGGAALSDAMVDLRATLGAAEMAGVVKTADRQKLIKALKYRPFPERHFAALNEDAVRLLDQMVARRLAAWLPSNKVSRKRLDAIEMLRAMADFLATTPAPFAASFVMQQPLFWRRFVAQCDAEEEDLPDPAARRVLERLRCDPAAWHACARAALGRLRRLTSVAEANAEAAPQPRRAFDRLRRERGLWFRSDVLAWVTANGLDEAGLERLLRREDELDRAVAEEPVGLLRAMADHLRMSGQFPAFLRDADGKAR
jgi:hypothetical protein